MAKPSSSSDDQQQPEYRRKPPWIPTLVAQAALCVVLYAFLNLGDGGGRGVRGGSLDLYFLSVRGGFRPAGEQAQLLKQMGAVAGARRIEFVLDISEYGDKDPLLGNATLGFPSLRIPWYATSVSRGSGMPYFHKKLRVHGEEILDIVGVDTGSLMNLAEAEKVNASRSVLYGWLANTLAVTDGTWRIVVGFHPLMDCEEGIATGKVKTYQRLHSIFIKHKVNAYLSKEGCSGFCSVYEGISYMENPGHLAAEGARASVADAVMDGDMHTGFLLHRIGPFEIDSYFINSTGDAILLQTMHQWGKQLL